LPRAPEAGFSRWPNFADRLGQLSYRDQQDLGERIYLAAVIHGLALAAAMFPEVKDDLLQEHLLQFAESTLARSRRRMHKKQGQAEPVTLVP
jgi:hypothetical protein